MTLERVCRALALAIVVAALVDPVWLAGRTAHPIVFVTGGIGATDEDVASVRAALADAADVRNVDSPDIGARVLVTDVPPRAWTGGPTFVVRPAADAARPVIRAVTVGGEVALDAAAAVNVSVVTPTAAGAFSLDVILLADQVLQDARTVPVGQPGGLVSVSLRYVPSRAGLARLTVVARAGAAETQATVATEVVAERLRVLVYEARPSWAGTFLRRALEADPRFDVVSRSTVSRGVSVETGGAPATLTGGAALDGFAAVIVAVPEALGSGEAEALRSYLRGREGVVVLVPQDAGGPVLSALTGISSWRVERRPTLELVSAGDVTWSASEFLWPGSWPRGAEALTSCLDSGARCGVWRVPLDGGRVVVSSALDGWRTRAGGDGSLASFWRGVIGAEAAVTPRAVSLRLESAVVAPGEFMTIEVRARGSDVPRVAGPEGPASLSDAGPPIRLWPVGRGTFVGEFRTPGVPGRYRVTTTNGAASSRREFLVAEPGTWTPPIPDAAVALDVFATAHGGEVITASDVDGLARIIADALGADTRITPTRPMRSPWWIVPFAGLLAVEWWSRRRRGAR